MGVTQINLGDSTERKCTKYGLAHQIPPDLSVRRKSMDKAISLVNGLQRRAKMERSFLPP